MKIKHVFIDNWEQPGEAWWKEVESRPTEPLIEATFEIKLSFEEYKKLLAQDENKTTPGASSCPAPSP